MLRKRIFIGGIVQAVGFRPFVYNLALKNGLCGFVLNSGRGVIIEAQGPAAAVQKFIAQILQNPPALSRIESVKTQNIALKRENSFIIKTSRRAGAAQTAVPPDIAICKDCQKDIADKNNRRYRYPFTNCTNCGPRFTIIKDLPYDRAQSTMKPFKMCPACRAEFENPQDRRFHAQPSCCAACGPRVWFVCGGKNIGGIEEAAAKIKQGKIIAIKSLGGFHLACDALNKAAVARLRARKNRPHKPLALMFGDIREIKKYCRVNAEEERLLKSAAAPAVMLKKRRDIALISDGLYTFGVMLPYTPMHKVLFDILGRGGALRGGHGPLVMTSGNISGRPICIDNQEALDDLGGIADGFLLHNRKIHNRIDDSVLFELGGKTHFLRRARGYAPAHIKLSSPLKKPALALGANLASSFCLGKGDKLFPSQYIGDLDNAGNILYFKETVKKMQRLLNIRPQIYLRDAHPGYYAAAYKPHAQKVLHHLAHALAVAAEHDLRRGFLCFAFDGAGLGADNTIWGAEFLEIGRGKWRRAGCLKPVRIFGGESATKDIWKCGLSYLLAAGFNDAQIKNILRPADTAAALCAARGNINCYTYSGAGRLFDAAAAILGLCAQTTYQAQGAMLLESAAARGASKACYEFALEEKGGLISVDTAPLIRGLAADRRRPAEAAAKFHNTLARIILAVALKLRAREVALCGGVFQNKILLARAQALLAAAGIKVYTNNILPAGDGAIAAGQLYAKYAGFV
ncbi:MAG: carbamoyltransferase HypF [Elusimicrobiota bacterium]|jgi:hydrogenase maturation protein HypF|nr:carbamoyltransferase HypF [Elusimicrobiota bacterium]